MRNVLVAFLILIVVGLPVKASVGCGNTQSGGPGSGPSGGPGGNGGGDPFNAQTANDSRPVTDIALFGGIGNRLALTCATKQLMGPMAG